MVHNCYKQEEKISAHEIYDLFIEWVAVCNISCRAAAHENIRKILSVLGVNRNLERHSIAEAIKNRAKQIQLEMLQKLRGKYVSILIDGAKKYWKQFEGVLLYTVDDIYFFSFVEIPFSISEILADIVKHVVESVEYVGGTVIAVCSDNASNNEKALNDKWKGSAQSKTHNHFIRIPCCAHIAELALSDIFGLKGQYHWLTKDINDIVGEAQKAGYVMKKISIRWSSMYDALSKIVYYQANLSHIPSITKYYDDIRSHFPNLYELLDILQITWNMVSQIEGDNESLADVFPIVFNAVIDLNKTNTRLGNEIANALYDRFTTTTHMQLHLFAYLLTKEGKRYYLTQTKDYNQRRKLEEFAKEGLVGYLEGSHQMRIKEECVNGFIKFLSLPDIDDAHSFFKNQSNEFVRVNPEFSIVCNKILSMPCSEAAVERLFSHLQHVFINSTPSISSEMINARVAIKMNYIFKHKLTPNFGNSFRLTVTSYENHFISEEQK